MSRWYEQKGFGGMIPAPRQAAVTEFAVPDEKIEKTNLVGFSASDCMTARENAEKDNEGIRQAYFGGGSGDAPCDSHDVGNVRAGRRRG